MNTSAHKSVTLSTKGDFQATVLAYMNTLLERDDIDAVMLPVKVPAGDSYAWILSRDTAPLNGANPVAPVMPVQGAKALKSLTRKSSGQVRAAVIMRPCEVRAAVELSKLNQVSRDNLLLISYDCPGAVPNPDYLKKPDESETLFSALWDNENFTSDAVKSVCGVCTDFTPVNADLHFSSLTGDKKKVLLQAGSEKGDALLEGLDAADKQLLTVWENKVKEIAKDRKAKQKQKFAEVKKSIDGLAGLQTVFSSCIGCHNCQSACPICYCRQCYFDSEVAKTASKITEAVPGSAGMITFPRDQVMFHVGRMTHMSLSCVACGQCTDVCPVDIPVADIFSYVGSETQGAFEYKAGNSEGEALPLKEFKLSEIANIDELVKSAESEETPHE